MNLYQHLKIYEEEYLEEEILENFETSCDGSKTTENKIEKFEIGDMSPAFNRPELNSQTASPCSKLTKVVEKKFQMQSLKLKQSKEWLCALCNKILITKSLLKIHMKDHKSSNKNHNKSDQSKEKGKRKKMCQLCGLSFAVNGWYHHVSILIPFATIFVSL